MGSVTQLFAPGIHLLVPPSPAGPANAVLACTRGRAAKSKPGQSQAAEGGWDALGTAAEEQEKAERLPRRCWDRISGLTVTLSHLQTL